LIIVFILLWFDRKESVFQIRKEAFFFGSAKTLFFIVTRISRKSKYNPLLFLPKNKF